MHGRYLSGIEPGERHKQFSQYGVLFVGHRRRTPCVVQRDFVDALLRHEANVLSHFAKRSTDQRQQPSVVDYRVAHCVPCLWRVRETEL